MPFKIFWMLFIYTAVLGLDFRAWKQAARKDRLVYGILLATSVYLSVLYLAKPAWPNLDQLLKLVFAEPAERFIKLLKVNSE